MVVSFASGLTVECEPTSDRLKLTEAIRRVGRGFNTKLYDAVAWVMKERSSRLRGRKAVVLLTDGVDAKSKHATLIIARLPLPGSAPHRAALGLQASPLRIRAALRTEA